MYLKLKTHPLDGIYYAVAKMAYQFCGVNAVSHLDANPRWEVVIITTGVFRTLI